MKTTTLIGAICLSVIFGGAVVAHEGHDHGTTSDGTLSASDAVKEKVSAAGTMTTKPTIVMNKICPVSGDKIGGEMGEAVPIEYEGKTYYLCCTMCIKDFQKDPQKYIDKINAEMKASGAQEK